MLLILIYWSWGDTALNRYAQFRMASEGKTIFDIPGEGVSPRFFIDGMKHIYCVSLKPTIHIFDLNVKWESLM